ncbi:MAG: hypothetical protein ACFN4S_02125 [Prevotella conceptionensis]
MKDARQKQKDSEEQYNERQLNPCGEFIEHVYTTSQQHFPPCKTLLWGGKYTPTKRVKLSLWHYITRHKQAQDASKHQQPYKKIRG